MALLGAGGAVGYLVAGQHTPPPIAQGGGNEVPHVTVAALEQREIQQVIVAYGSVTAAPAHSHTINVAFEGMVQKILVMPGQLVAAGEAVLEIAASPETRLSAVEARSELAGAERELDVLREKLKLGLATRIDLDAAELRVQNAKSKLASLAGRGGGKGLTLRAAQAGVVSQIHVATGQIIGAGDALLELIDKDSLEMIVGVEPEDTAAIVGEQAVEIEAIGASASKVLHGRVVGVAQRVNPETRLVDVTVKADPGATLLLNEFVRAKIIVRSSNTIVAPRAALLPTSEGYLVMLVQDGKAVLRPVELGIENDDFVELRAQGLAAAAQVVVAGATGLADGSMVVAEPAP